MQTSINLLPLRCQQPAAILIGTRPAGQSSRPRLCRRHAVCCARRPKPVFMSAADTLNPHSATTSELQFDLTFQSSIRGVPYLPFKLPCPEPIAFTASLRLYCFTRRFRGFLSDAGTPYRKVFPISFLCRTSPEQSPFEVPATKEGENFLHGFDTALRALTLDYARLSTNLRSIR